MKKATIIIFLGAAVAAAAAVNPLSWKNTTLELGSVKVGEKKELTFEFTNTGDAPVTILEAKGSCGCTDVKIPKTAIEAGATASITATFSAKSEGVFRKNIRIKTSGNAALTYLYFSGEVIK